MPRICRLVAISFALLTLLLTWDFTSAPSLRQHHPHAVIPANSTLGFGAIIAVSHPRSPRRTSLLWAANLTDLDIVIPDQPEWTEADIEAFKCKESSTISRGSALAWMGHLHVLKWFLNTSHPTALVIEDDTDFSLSLRPTQIPLLATAVRRLFNSSSPTTMSKAFWGPEHAWDILYPGHCDDLPSPLYASHPAILYRDPTAPGTTSLHPATHHFMAYLNVPSRSRLVHRAFFPFCTFAYAVTRRSATQIVKEFGEEKTGGMSAFDVQLLEACRDGWRCWSVVPEVFHHGVGGSEISHADGKDLHSGHGGDGDGGEGEGDGVQQERGYVRPTWNIGCGARSEKLWVDERNGRGREERRGVVRGHIERGECPVARAGEEGWVGCEEGECGAQS